MKSAGTLHKPNNDEVVAQVFGVLNVSDKRGIKEANGRFRIIEGDDKFRSLWVNDLQAAFYLRQTMFAQFIPIASGLTNGFALWVRASFR
jgi:hypothetical protein